MATCLSLSVKWIAVISLAAVTVLAVTLFFALGRKRYVLLSVALCLSSVALALTSSAVRIDSKRTAAEELIGEQSLQMSILEKDYSSEHSSAYVVRVERTPSRSVDFKAMLVCDFNAELSVGDLLYANVRVVDSGTEIMGRSASERTGDSDVVAGIMLTEDSQALVERFDRDAPIYKSLFEKNGVRVWTDKLREGLSARCVQVFGERMGALVKGFLVGDTSDVDSVYLRNFRRSGVSHLFAVSGMHVSIFLGAIDRLLKKLLVPKKVRIASVLVLSVGFLLLTGFSVSALRSVFMLWIAYLIFLVSEEADMPTVLFLAVALTVGIFPFSVYELGLWMSFLATLGLVTVYPIFNKIIPMPSKKKGARRILLLALRGAVFAGITTLIATMFLLTIQWGIFGELSLTSVPANILLSPMSTAFMVLGALTLALGGISLLGSAMVFTVGLIGDGMLYASELLSAPRFATVSMKYAFAVPMMIVFTVALSVLLIVRLRRKWLVITPFVAFVAAFSLGIGVFHATAQNKLTYYSEGRNEVLTVVADRELCVVDMSDGDYFRFSTALKDGGSYGATEIETVVFTRITGRHISTMDYFFRNKVVRNIYVSMPRDVAETENAISLTALAEECGVAVHLYDSGDLVDFNGTAVCISRETVGDRNAVGVFVCGEENTLAYVDAYMCESGSAESVDKMLSISDTVIIGNKGIPDKPYKYAVSEKSTVIYASEELMKKSRIEASVEKIYYNSRVRNTLEFLFK